MNLLRKIKIGTRLYSMYAILMVLLLFIAYSGIRSRLALIDETVFMQKYYIDNLTLIESVNAATGDLFIAYRNYYLEYPDEGKMQSNLNNINTCTGFILTNLLEYQNSLISRNAPQDELNVANNVISKFQNDVVSFNTKITGFIKDGQMDEAYDLITSDELNLLKDELQDNLLKTIYNECTDNVNSVLNGNISGMKSSNISIIILCAFGVVLVISFAILIVRSVIVPIKELMVVSNEIAVGKIDVVLPKTGQDEIGELAEQFGLIVKTNSKQAELIKRISKGDLSDNYKPRSEFDVVGQSLAEMLERNNSALIQVQISSEQLLDASNDISLSSQSLAQGATQQACAITELTSSVSEITNTIHSGTGMVSKATDLSISIKNSAEKGSHQMQQMVKAIDDIKNSSSNVNKIMKVIDDIAFQTNILALNAAVEAARAGTHGKGFAVVAEEVRNLASKSAAAAKDTGSLINDTIEKSELGVQITNDTALSFSEIVNGINENSQIIFDIAEANKKQEIEIDRIYKTIGQVSDVVQQTSATAEESAAASEQMTAQTALLKESVAKFKLKTIK